MKHVILAVVLVTCGAGSSFAQQDVPPRGNRPPATGLSPVEVADMMDAWALMQAETQLRLRDEQFADFVSRLKALQQTRRRNLQRRNQLLREIGRLVLPQQQQGGEGDESLVRDKLKALREHDDRAAAELRKAYDHLDEMLDARQQARFRLFEENIERRKLDLLMRARQGAARGRGGS